MRGQPSGAPACVSAFRRCILSLCGLSRARPTSLQGAIAGTGAFSNGSRELSFPLLIKKNSSYPTNLARDKAQKREHKERQSKAVLAAPNPWAPARHRPRAMGSSFLPTSAPTPPPCYTPASPLWQARACPQRASLRCSLSRCRLRRSRRSGLRRKRTRSTWVALTRMRAPATFTTTVGQNRRAARTRPTRETAAPVATPAMSASSVLGRKLLARMAITSVAAAGLARQNWRQWRVGVLSGAQNHGAVVRSGASLGL